MFDDGTAKVQKSCRICGFFKSGDICSISKEVKSPEHICDVFRDKSKTLKAFLYRDALITKNI